MASSQLVFVYKAKVVRLDFNSYRRHTEHMHEADLLCRLWEGPV